MKLNRRSTSILSYRVFFWTLVACGLLLFLADKRPLVLSADDPASRGAWVNEESGGDIVVVLDPGTLVEAAERGRFARSWAWVDLVRQEIGPVATLRADELTPEALRPYRVAILTESAATSPALARRLTELQAFVGSGGILALELPSGPLREAFAADGSGGWRTPSAITAVNGTSDEAAETLRQMPMMTRFMGSTRPAEGATTLLAMDGAPVIYSRIVGRGQVVVFDFDVSAQLSAMQQGLPSDRMRVRPRQSGDPIRTSDLVASPALFGATIPWADVLERYIAHAVLGSEYPMFAFWPWPGTGKGAFITSHQSRHVSGRPLWMSIHERSSSARSTTFVAAPDPSRDRQNIADPEFAGHAAMLWVLDPRQARLHQSWGLLGMEPVIQPLTLAAQRSHLTRALERISADDLHGVRIWDSRWQHTFTEPYRVMQAHGFRYSVSYGPSPGLPPGYLFGTCQPFQPVDSDGLPFALFEVPVCFEDPVSEQELELFGAVLRRAVEQYHAVHLMTSSDLFRERPDMAGFDAWRDALRFAEQSGMWVGGAGQLVDFRRRRSASDLRIAASAIEGRTADGRAQEMRFVLEIEAQSPDLTLMLPERVAGLTLRTVSRGARTQRGGAADSLETREVTYGGLPFQLLPVPTGFTTLTVFYGR